MDDVSCSIMASIAVFSSPIVRAFPCEPAANSALILHCPNTSQPTSRRQWRVDVEAVATLQVQPSLPLQAIPLPFLG